MGVELRILVTASRFSDVELSTQSYVWDATYLTTNLPLSDCNLLEDRDCVFVLDSPTVPSTGLQAQWAINKYCQSTDGLKSQ